MTIKEMAIEEKPVDTEQSSDRKPESEYNFYNFFCAFLEFLSKFQKIQLFKLFNTWNRKHVNCINRQ